MSIQWFPGHMTAARKKAAETLAHADVVVEVLDARLPQASSNPMIHELRAARPDLVFMDADQRDDLARRYPDVLARIEALLAADYEPRATDALDGRWWERAPAARGGECPARAAFVIPGR